MTRVAVVGVGVMGERHARVVAQSERAKLVYVADPDETVGRTVADRYDTTWRPEFDPSHVDAVVIASPTEHHVPMVRDALNAGVPVLVEKPVGVDLTAALRMASCSQRTGVPLMCGLVERFNPAVMTVRSLVPEPVHVTSQRVVPHYARIQTAVSWDLLIHHADLALRLFGRPPGSATLASGRFHPDSSREDVADLLLDFAPGVASLSASKIGQRRSWTLRATTVDREVVADLVNPSVTLHLPGAVVETPLVSHREPLAAQLDHFLDLVAGVADPELERQSWLSAHHVIGMVQR